MRLEDVPFTHKVSSDRLDLRVIEALDRAVSENVTENIPTNMEEIRKILQTVQAAYQEATKKDKKQSSWVASIEAKAKMLSDKVSLLVRKRDGKLLDKAENKKAAQF